MKPGITSSNAAELMDLRHYGAQARRSFSTLQAAYAHFVAEGQAQGLDPAPYFSTCWYAWQNATLARCVLDHFLEHASQQPVDPAPFIDMVGLLRKTPAARDALDLYRMLLRGALPDVPPLLDEHLARLRAARDAFHNRITLQTVRDTGRRRRNLVWVQSGRAFRLPTWFKPDAPRDWDLLLNWYDLGCMDLRFGEVVLRQSGTKATGIHQVLARHPELLTRYDNVVFLDDDLVVQHADLDQVFELAGRHGLDLFQPSLSAGSHCSWPHLFHRRGLVVRETTGVEIMMFGFTRRALAACALLFRGSVSGFGLDVACSRTVRDQGWACGVIDAVQVGHPDAIDESGGSYYEFMRANDINQKLELWEEIRASGKYPAFVTLDGEPPLRRLVHLQATRPAGAVADRNRACA